MAPSRKPARASRKGPRPGSSGAGRGPASRRSRRRPNLRVVEARPRPKRLRFVVASCALIAPLVMGVVTVQTVVSQNAFRMRELSRETVSLQQGYKELKLQVAELSAPRRIAREAAELGLRLPERVHVLPVEGGGEAAAETDTGPSFALKSMIEGRP